MSTQNLLLSYRVVGDGPPLLLVHGLGVSFGAWEKLIPLLESNFSLVMLELPGIGESPVPGEGVPYLQAASNGIQQLRRQLNIKSWDVLGYSVGTRVVEAYLRVDARAVKKAVLLCPLKIRKLLAVCLQIVLWLDGAGLKLGKFLLSGRRIKLLVSLMAFSGHAEPCTGEWTRGIDQGPHDVMLDTLDNMPGGGARPFDLPMLPCLFIWGKEDRIAATPRHPGVRDCMISGNHSLPISKPESVAALVQRYLTG